MFLVKEILILFAQIFLCLFYYKINTLFWSIPYFNESALYDRIGWFFHIISLLLINPTMVHLLEDVF